MRAEDRFFSKVHRYSLGVETDSGRFYAAIPVSNGPLDYEEYYELTPERFADLMADATAAVEFVESCRRRECDHLLIQKPGWDRGTPV